MSSQGRERMTDLAVVLVPGIVLLEVVVLALSLVSGTALQELVAPVRVKLLQVGRVAPSVSSVARGVTLQHTALEDSS